MKKIKNIQINKRNSIIVITVFALLGISLLIYSKAATPPASSPGGIVSLAAGNAEYTLSPNTGSYKSGTDFTVSIFENSGTVPVAGVDAFLTYDATKLDFVSVNTTGGVFTDCFSNTGNPNPTGGNGTVKFGCIKLGSTFTGNQKIGNVTFRPKVGTGSTAITFASNSAIYDESVSSVWNGVATGGTYTLGSTTTTPPPTGGGGTTTPISGGSTAPSSGTSGGSKAKPSTTTPGSGGAPTTGGGSAGAPVTGPSTSGDASSAPITATTTPNGTKIATNTNAMYAGIIVGVAIIASVSGTAFLRIRKRSKFNNAHGLGGNNSAFVFDTNKAPAASSGIDQGAIVTPQTTATAPSAPAQVPKADTKGPEGNIITPNGPKTPTAV